MVNAVTRIGQAAITAEAVIQQAKFLNPDENIPVNEQGTLHVTEDYEEKVKLTRKTLISKVLIGTIILTVMIPTDDATVATKATEPLLQEDNDWFKETIKGLTTSETVRGSCCKIR